MSPLLTFGPQPHGHSVRFGLRGAVFSKHRVSHWLGCHKQERDERLAPFPKHLFLFGYATFWPPVPREGTSWAAKQPKETKRAIHTTKPISFQVYLLNCKLCQEHPASINAGSPCVLVNACLLACLALSARPLLPLALLSPSLHLLLITLSRHPLSTDLASQPRPPLSDRVD